MRRHWIERTAPPPTGAAPVYWEASPIEPMASTLAAMPSAWECDLKDDSLIWAPGVFELFGISPGMRIDRRETVEMYDEESRILLERLRSDAIARRGSFTFEAQIRRTDGERRWLRITADVACSNGRATHLYGLKQDITAEMLFRTSG